MTKPDLILIGVYPDDSNHIKGGIQAATYGLAQSLKSSSALNSMRVIALPVRREARNRVDNPDKFSVWFLDAPMGFLSSSIVHLPKIMAIVRACHAPIVHMHGTGIIQVFTAVWLRATGRRFLWTLHGLTGKETWHKFQRRRTARHLAHFLLYQSCEWILAHICPHIVVDTDYVRNAITTPHRIHVIPQGVFLEELSPFAANRRDQPIILSVGVIDPRKGHHNLIDAFAQIAGIHPEARLVIAGALTNSSYYQQLRQKIAHHNLGSRVRIVTDAPRSILLDWLGKAQIFALHSTEESQGIVLCEAMAGGLPIVATKVGGIPDVVRNGIDGLLTANQNITDFAASLHQLLSNPDLRRHLSRQAHDRAQNYGWPRIAATLLKLYQTLAPPPQLPPP